MSAVVISAPFARRQASEPRLRLVLFGPMQAEDASGESVLPRGRKSRAALAVLALAAPRAVPRQTLTALLWSTRDREQARASLRQTVRELQEALTPLGPGILHADRGTLALAADAITADTESTPPAPFLQDLVGLDPAFDTWIAATERRLANAPGPAAAHPPGDGARDATRDAARHAARHAPADAPGPAAVAAPAPSRRRGAAGVRLGVMPFRNLETGRPDLLSFGLAEEITAAMSRFRGVTLIASPSLAVIQDCDPADREAALDSLALDFLIDGTIRRAGHHVRVTAQLLDMQADTPGGRPIVSAQRFDATDADLLTLQDRIAAEMVARADPEMLLRAGARARTLTTADPGAYELMLRAIPAIYWLERGAFEQAGVLLRAAIARDPDYAAAHAWLGWWLLFRIGQGWSNEPDADLAAASEVASRAVAIDPSDARALAITGHVRAFQRRLPEAHALHAQALEANPNLSLAWVLAGLAHAYDGEHAASVRCFETAERLSPFDPHRAFFDSGRMLPLVMLGEYGQAAAIGRRAITAAPSLTAAYKGMLAALGYLGDAFECTRVRTELLALEPRFSVQAALARSPLHREEDRAVYAEGLRRGGLREEAFSAH